MTDFEKVKKYYSEFDEKNRLTKDYSGRFEYEMTMKILNKYLPSKATILDLGGAAGAYTIPLAKKGYEMYLADLSEKLINQAEVQIEKENIEKVKSCDIVNAIDLSIYENEQFDVVLLFGPLYHLLTTQEREKVIKEINRVLRNGGLVFASFIPYLAGSIAIIDRYIRHPEQVDTNNLTKVFNTGEFNNASNNGFQEGSYIKSEEIVKLFENNNFEKQDILSIRGFGYEREEQLYNIKDKEMLKTIIELIQTTANQKEIIETCGHAIYIGKKTTN